MISIPILLYPIMLMLVTCVSYDIVYDRV